MKLLSQVAIVLLCWSAVFAADVQIQGRVTDSEGNPVENASVQLLGEDLTTSTDAEGLFTLTTGSSPILQPRKKQIHQSIISGRNIGFTITKENTPVFMSIIDLRGKKLWSGECGIFSPGNHSIDPIAVAGLENVKQMLIVKINIAGVSSVHKVFSMGKTLHSDNHFQKLSKQSADTPVDTLKIVKTGYCIKRVPVQSYSETFDPIVLETGATMELFANANSESSILFFAETDSGNIYYHGFREEDNLITLVTFEKDTENKEAIIYSSDLLPVQWIIGEYNIAIYNKEGVFDPDNALHVMVLDSSVREDTASFDILPEDLTTAIPQIEQFYTIDMSETEAMLSESNISTYAQLLTQAKIVQDDQPLFISAAIGISTAYAAMNISEYAPALAKRSKTAIAGGAFDIATGVGKTAAKNLGRELLGKWLDPEPSGIGVLLCQSAGDRHDDCNHTYFKCKPTPTGAVDPEALTRCMNFCRWVTLGCFNNICMPMDLSEAEALDFAGRLMGAVGL